MTISEVHTQGITLSVIVPCYNAAETIGDQLDALARQRCSKPWEIIVSDNGSSDGSMTVVERYQKSLPNLGIVDASDKRGAAHARNVGARAARGEALAFCDADDMVAPGWLAAIGEALSRHDFVACRIDSEKLNPSWIKGRHGNAQRDGVQISWYPPYLPYAGAGTLGIKRSLHEAVCGFDESLLALEDNDYCFRIQFAGGKLHFVPEAVVHVRYRHDLRGAFRQSRLWAEYSVLIGKKYGSRCSPTFTPRTWKQHFAFLMPWRQYMLGWKRLLLRLPQIRHRAGRAAWVRLVGNQIGLLQGSLKHRSHPV